MSRGIASHVKYTTHAKEIWPAMKYKPEVHIANSLVSKRHLEPQYLALHL